LLQVWTSTYGTPPRSLEKATLESSIKLVIMHRGAQPVMTATNPASACHYTRCSQRSQPHRQHPGVPRPPIPALHCTATPCRFASSITDAQSISEVEAASSRLMRPSGPKRVEVHSTTVSPARYPPPSCFAGRTRQCNQSPLKSAWFRASRALPPPRPAPLHPSRFCDVGHHSIPHFTRSRAHTPLRQWSTAKASRALPRAPL
jgi:hypothetical protein